MTLKLFRMIASYFLLASSPLLQATDQLTYLPPTIPVVDMRDFYNPETKQQFIDDVAKALHEVGFFAVVNPGMDMDILESSYQTAISFFKAPLEKKLEICKRELNGQRGYVYFENAQGNAEADFKEFLHIARDRNVWPEWMDLEAPMTALMHSLDKSSEDLQRAFALALGEEENFLVETTVAGDCLLRPIHYPATTQEGQIWAVAHTDIDYFTILPLATEDGLQLLFKGEWIDVRVPPNAFIVNCGDMLQSLSNGYFKSSFHRVVSKPGAERYSIVYFIHPKAEDSTGPTKNAIALTGGIQRYPESTRMEQLARRLCEIGLASPELIEYDRNTGLIERIQALVEAGVADDPVLLTYNLWVKAQNLKEE